MLPDFINKKYDGRKFKLVCDDLGLANLMVKSKDDLTIVGVVDLEWSYIGPAQLFGSAPWWLLQDRPINSAWDCHDGKLPVVADRYFRYLEIFKRVLEEEEAKMPGHEDKELSTLVKWSQDSGAMWLHMLLVGAFNAPNTFPFVQLRQHAGAEKWTTYATPFTDEEALEEFATCKMHKLQGYEEALEKREREKKLVDSDEMTEEEFLRGSCPTVYLHI